MGVVHSVGLNPLGYKLMGTVPWPIARYPIVAENDFAGTIADANGHTDWHVGQGAFAYVAVGQCYRLNNA